MRRALPFLSPTRVLTPAALLKTVRTDPGMTASYYANRYFGKETAMAVNHLLWSELKRHGKITLDRSDGMDEPPRWYPTFEAPRRHVVRWHDPAEEDLSILEQQEQQQQQHYGDGRNGSGSAPSPDETDSLRLETLVLHLVQQEPERDIQYYIGLLPFEMRAAAPLVFKRLRESELLKRETTPRGTYVWR